VLQSRSDGQEVTRSRVATGNVPRFADEVRSEGFLDNLKHSQALWGDAEPA